jgi:hypothetical protein
LPLPLPGTPLEPPQPVASPTIAKSPSHAKQLVLRPALPDHEGLAATIRF